MSTKIKWLIALLVAAGTVTVASAIGNTIYLPIVAKNPPPTHTPTPTATATVTVTPTPTLTPTPAPGIYINTIDYDPAGDPLNDEYIEIKNTGTKNVDMQNWFIKAESGAKYVFPSFTLNAGKSVRIWSGLGQDSSADLYWGSAVPVWNDRHDVAYLKDNDNKLIDSYSY